MNLIKKFINITENFVKSLFILKIFKLNCDFLEEEYYLNVCKF